MEAAFPRQTRQANPLLVKKRQRAAENQKHFCVQCSGEADSRLFGGVPVSTVVFTSSGRKSSDQEVTSDM